MKIKIIDATVLDGAIVEPGQSVETDENTAAELVAMGRAVYPQTKPADSEAVAKPLAKTEAKTEAKPAKGK